MKRLIASQNIAMVENINTKERTTIDLVDDNIEKEITKLTHGNKDAFEVKNVQWEIYDKLDYSMMGLDELLMLQKILKENNQFLDEVVMAYLALVDNSDVISAYKTAKTSNAYCCYNAINEEELGRNYVYEQEGFDNLSDDLKEEFFDYEALGEYIEDKNDCGGFFYGKYWEFNLA